MFFRIYLTQFLEGRMKMNKLELEIRISELEQYKKEISGLDELKAALKKTINDLISEISILLGNNLFASDENKELKTMVDFLKSSLIRYLDELNKNLYKAEPVKSREEVALNRTKLDEINNLSSEKKDSLKTQNKDTTTDIVVKIELARKSYALIKTLKNEKEILEGQRASIEFIYSEFANRQKSALESFLASFSEDIDDFYQFMNPGEKVTGINLVPIEKDDELVGLTFEFNFFNKQESPPHKYLSESHINCLGIAFFLTSVKAFNHANKFFILDDVISSFDANHRKRFADLLVEKYSDYQIILLTHEQNWFECVRNLIKGKNWKVNTLKSIENQGIIVEEAPKTLKDRIETNIKSSEKTGLGNDLRKYLEQLLKVIACNLQVKVAFLYNNENEDRMPYELLCALKGTINKRKCQELKDQAVIDRLLASTFIGNKDSHDSSFDPSLGDLKAFWDEIKEFEELFFCANDCGKYLSLDNYDTVNNKIRCGCGNVRYEWKK